MSDATRTERLANPNNCATCDHKKQAGEGWCYMFRDEPKDVCFQHTGRSEVGKALISFAMLGMGK